MSDRKCTLRLLHVASTRGAGGEWFFKLSSTWNLVTFENANV
jgi:hypothetical protein